MTDFNDNWKFANEIRQGYGKYTKQTFMPMRGKTFKKGGQKYLAMFADENGVVHRHEAMQRESIEKKKIYYLVNVLTIGQQENKQRASSVRCKAQEEALKQAVLGYMKDEDSGDDIEDLSIPEPLTYLTRDFKQGHVEHE